MSDFLLLKTQRDLKYKEIKLIEDQARLLNQEILLREKMIKAMFEKAKLLQAEAQEIADKMIELEYKACIENNI